MENKIRQMFERKDIDVESDQFGDGKKKKKKKKRKLKKKRVTKGVKVSQSNKQIVNVIIGNLLKNRPKRKRKAKKKGKPKQVDFSPVANATLAAQTQQSLANYAKFVGYKNIELKNKEIKELQKAIGNLPEAQQKRINSQLDRERLEEMKKLEREFDDKLKAIKLKGDLQKFVDENQELAERLPSIAENLEKLQLEARMFEASKRGEALKGTGAQKLEQAIKNDEGLLDSQITEIMADEPHFSGVIAADEIHNLKPKKNMNIIINHDVRGLPGSHWCAIRIDSRSRSVEYYDPLAEPIPKKIDSDLRKYVDEVLDPDDQYKYKINKKRNQSSTSSSCGFFAILFLMAREDGDTFPQATNFTEKDVKESREKDGDMAGYGQTFGFI